MFLVDSHCHLDLLNLTDDPNDLQQVITRAQQAGVHHMLNVCVKLADFPTILATAEKFPFVSASVGLHPNDTDEEATQETLMRLAQHKKVVAIGETGLDYFRSTGDVEWQRERFRTHIRAANALQKPLIVHTRAAKQDTMRIMQEENAAHAGGVMHCFSEDWDYAQQALDLNFYISFSGVVTFKNTAALQEVAKKIPLNRMLIETDAPYLAPVPYRGKPNEPAYVRHTAECIAALRNIPVSELAEQTTHNFFELFKGAVRHHV